MRKLFINILVSTLFRSLFFRRSFQNSVITFDHNNVRILFSVSVSFCPIQYILSERSSKPKWVRNSYDYSLFMITKTTIQMENSEIFYSNFPVLNPSCNSHFGHSENYFSRCSWCHSHFSTSLNIHDDFPW